MSGEVEAAGTAIEGALLGATVDGMGGAMADEAEGKCLNCRAQLSGSFCATCGQKAHVHRTLSAIWHDILHSVLHFDGKLWRTLPMLVFKPGELTRRYVHGERAKFISPMALFLFSIFMMFAVFSFTGGATFGGSSNFDFKKEMAAEAVKLDKKISETERLLTNDEVPSAAKPAIIAQLNKLKSERNGIALATTGKPIYSETGTKVDIDDMVSMNSIGSDTGWKWLDKKLNSGGLKMMQNPGLALYKLQSNGYKFAWLLIPLSLPFVWLVTLGGRGHHFYDHAVFTTYSMSFMCLLFLTIAVLAKLGTGDDLGVAIFLIAPPLHLYKQLRHAYGLSRISTLIRLLALLFFIVIILTLFSMILLFLGLLG
jgi:hypothetical protein